VLGVALGGFFDGILLHQVLQWHHLLSLVPGEDLRRIETQILADGAFHVLMWLIAVAGLGLLWRARDDLARDRSGRVLAAALLLGFGAWNAVDVIGFHWILHIHRIRVDVPVGDRLRWDLGWLALFAAVPLVAAWFTARGGGGGPAPRSAGAALALLVVGAAALSLRRTAERRRLAPCCSAPEAARPTSWPRPAPWAGRWSPCRATGWRCSPCRRAQRGGGFIGTAPWWSADQARPRLA
jgi:uncharacterized membrane protein